MWAKAYRRVILRAGCLGPKTSRRKAVKLHKMPKKQKAAMTRNSKIVWELMQQSVGKKKQKQRLIVYINFKQVIKMTIRDYIFVHFVASNTEETG